MNYSKESLFSPISFPSAYRVARLCVFFVVVVLSYLSSAMHQPGDQWQTLVLRLCVRTGYEQISPGGVWWQWKCSRKGIDWGFRSINKRNGFDHDAECSGSTDSREDVTALFAIC